MVTGVSTAHRPQPVRRSRQRGAPSWQARGTDHATRSHPDRLAVAAWADYGEAARAQGHAMTDTPSFVVHRRTPGFTPLWHDVANDDGSSGAGPGLSYRALGLLAFMLSRPPGWAFSRDRLCRGPGGSGARRAREGRESVAATLRELIDAGYYRTRKVQTQTGRWVTVTEVTDTPGHWGDDA